jgi:hypothetical protein
MTSAAPFIHPALKLLVFLKNALSLRCGPVSLAEHASLIRAIAALSVRPFMIQ